MDDMLAEMTADEFDERFAFYQMSGEGDARYLAGVVAATVHNEMERYLSAKAGQPLKQDRLHNPEHYLPDAMRTRHKKPKTERIQATDPDAAERTAKQLGIF